MRNLWITLLAIAGLALNAGALSAQTEPAYNSDLDYIKKTGRLWGIAALKINTDNTVTLIDADYDEDLPKQVPGYGLSFWPTSEDGMITPDNQNQVTLQAGQSCKLSDGHHANITYTLIGVAEGKATIQITERFDARSFGAGIQESAENVTIQPYQTHE